MAGVDDFALALPVGDEGGDGFWRPSRHARGAWGGGLPFGDAIAQLDLMQLARNDAFLIFEHAPKLERPENGDTKALIVAARKATFAQVS